jgi:hypothetical protein
MFMTVYTLNKDAKEIWCIRVWTVRARLGISGKSGYSGKKIRTLRAFTTPVKHIASLESKNRINHHKHTTISLKLT